jgi:hypothetical protein
MVFRLLLFFLIVFIIEVYAFQAVKTFTKVRWVLLAYSSISLAVILFIAYQFTQFDRSVGQTKMTMITMGLVLLVSIPKIIITLLLLLEDIFRVFSGTINRFSKPEISTGFLPDRRKFISQIALGIAAVPFASLIYGMTLGKYNYKVITQQIFFPDLPDAFDGFKITQISDIHSGSFDNPEKINFIFNEVQKLTSIRNNKDFESLDVKTGYLIALTEINEILIKTLKTP